MNRYFKVQPDSLLFDEEAFGTARAAFFEQRDHFIDRLACAQFFDAERFDAMLLWSESLKRFHDANSEPIPPSYFEPEDLISRHLEIQSKYSTIQKQLCAEALGRWAKTLTAFGVR